MNFVEELRWRGMLNDMTPEAEEKLNEGMTTGYIGFDPTAPSMTIGNYVQIMLLSFWQRSGNKPIVLFGGATGRIGDPSGKDQERVLKSFEELDYNLAKQIEQTKKFLNFETGDNKAVIVNNLDFYSGMNVLDFLRDVGKTITVNYMMSKDSVKNRLEKGLSFTEFSYQLLQAYDFQKLFTDQNCLFQMGGSDQWGNITSGTEFIRKNTGGKAYAVTTPLLTKADGSKFGKSMEGNIWLDPTMTSPYRFYQFWLNADDADLEKYFKYFSFKTKDEIENLLNNPDADPRNLKKILAEELTIRVHSQEDFDSVLLVSEMLFNKKASPESLKKMSIEALKTIGEEIESYQASIFGDEIAVLDLLAETTNIVSSKGEAKRAIKNNAVAINKIKIKEDGVSIKKDELLHGKFLLIENGKKNKYLVHFS